MMESAISPRSTMSSAVSTGTSMTSSTSSPSGLAPHLGQAASDVDIGLLGGVGVAQLDRRTEAVPLSGDVPRLLLQLPLDGGQPVLVGIGGSLGDLPRPRVERHPPLTDKDDVPLVGHGHDANGQG